ncbi:sialate O-acetylesterase [Arcticibacter tournemirensis]|uniref:Sialate O-acetylesterase n=2 Tax=Arcticibacter tournemirensis TaxID=699437 RepID=A0A5M9H919_9SPHI|nr:sialate O-acetylesterase [Arcticibacter tournemirensis]KAA8483423.1 sialate O-acetylesterase [Arcticibacter tournemirensis]
MDRFKTILILFLSVVLHIGTITAQIRLPQLIRDSMVLQRNTTLKLWGWASPGEKIKIRFNGKSVNTSAGRDGKWNAALPAMKPGGPFEMQLTGKNSIILKDILIGDVWLCSGQSNMVHQMGIHNITYAEDIANANFLEIRQFLVPTTTSLSGPREDVPQGRWKWANPEDVRDFSAVAYFFARHIYNTYHIPVGIINSSVGGTPIEAWTSAEGLKEFSSLTAIIKKNQDTTYVAGLKRAARTVVVKNDEPDKGLSAPVKWFDTAYVAKGWRNINIPGYWEDQGIRDLDGVVWYRKEVIVPASMTGKPGRLFMGRIVDADVVYVNGKQIGSTAYMYPQRRYSVPPDALKPGKNLIVVRVQNNSGKGGFVPDKPYYLDAEGQKLDLKGDWLYKVGQVYRPVSRRSQPLGISEQNQPTALYNAMIAPFCNYPIKGVLWYQGESNIGNGHEYEKLLPALIKDWRARFSSPGLPFYYVQLPNFGDASYLPGESGSAVVREAALKTLKVPNTGMAVTIDLGEWNDIHPDNKKDVGDRLALLARHFTYGEKDLVYSGPLYRSSEIQGNKVLISFTNTGSGLISIDGEELSEFAVAGADKKFVWARARIVGDKVEVWSDEVPNPKYVRYAWADNPVQPNLYNFEKLPASPFRTGE